jgi:hypothetical protein
MLGFEICLLGVYYHFFGSDAWRGSATRRNSRLRWRIFNQFNLTQSLFTEEAACMAVKGTSSVG